MTPSEALSVLSCRLPMIDDELDAAFAVLMELAATKMTEVVADNERLREALQWFVDNDETNEGDEPMEEYGGKTWNELNAYWIDGLNRARILLNGANT